jgi:hypothetical protein
MKINAINARDADASTIIRLRCPSCRHQGNFTNLAVRDIFIPREPSYVLGQRRCPDPNCATHVFFVYSISAQKCIAFYPAERIDFDSTNIPSSILAALEEAITCHANQCYVASAIMVRKTLEELCKERGATGKNLKERLKDLGSRIIVPQPLLDGLDNLRLLGNDAAHIELEHFNGVGEPEVSLAIDISKKLLETVYQYDALLARLESYKKP